MDLSFFRINDFALSVARRRVKSLAVLVIDAEKLRRHGYKIFRAGKNIYLVNLVPSNCIVKIEFF